MSNELLILTAWKEKGTEILKSKDQGDLDNPWFFSYMLDEKGFLVESDDLEDEVFETDKELFILTCQGCTGVFEQIMGDSDLQSLVGDTLLPYLEHAFTANKDAIRLDQSPDAHIYNRSREVTLVYGFKSFLTHTPDCYEWDLDVTCLGILHNNVELFSLPEA